MTSRGLPSPHSADSPWPYDELLTNGGGMPDVVTHRADLGTSPLRRAPKTAFPDSRKPSDFTFNPMANAFQPPNGSFRDGGQPSMEHVWNAPETPVNFPTLQQPRLDPTAGDPTEVAGNPTLDNPDVPTAPEIDNPDEWIGDPIDTLATNVTDAQGVLLPIDEGYIGVAPPVGHQDADKVKGSLYRTKIGARLSDLQSTSQFCVVAVDGQIAAPYSAEYLSRVGNVNSKAGPRSQINFKWGKYMSATVDLGHFFVAQRKTYRYATTSFPLLHICKAPFVEHLEDDALADIGGPRKYTRISFYAGRSTHATRDELVTSLEEHGVTDARRFADYTSQLLAPSDELKRVDILLSRDCVTLESFLDRFSDVWRKHRSDDAANEAFKQSPRALDFSLKTAVVLDTDHQEPPQTTYWSNKTAVLARGYQSVYAHWYETAIANEFANVNFRGILIPLTSKLVGGHPYQYHVAVTKAPGLLDVPRPGTKVLVTLEAVWGLDELPSNISAEQKAAMIFKALQKADLQAQGAGGDLVYSIDCLMAMLCNVPEHRLVNTARALWAEEFALRALDNGYDDEDGDAEAVFEDALTQQARWKEYIKDHLDEFKIPKPQHSDENGIECNGVVLEPTSEFDSLGLFSVLITMRYHDNWPADSVIPPPIYYIKDLLLPRNLAKIPHKLVQQFSTPDNKFARAMRMTMVTDDQTVKAEIAAVNMFNCANDKFDSQRKSPAFLRFADFTQRYDGHPDIHHIQRAFPFLAGVQGAIQQHLRGEAPTGLPQSHPNLWKYILGFDRSQMQAVLDMNDRPFGLYTLTGGPGSGKSNLAMFILSAMQVAEVDASFPVTVDQCHSLPAGRHPALEPDAIPDAWTGMTFRQTVPVAVPATTGTAPLTVRLFACGTSNNQCDQLARDLANMYAKIDFKGRVGRIRPFKRELAEVRGKDRPDDRVFDEIVDDIMDAQRALQTIADSLKVDQENRRAAMGDAMDVSMIAWDIILSNNEFRETRELHQLQFTDPALFAIDRDKWSEGIKRAVEMAVISCSALVGTPVAAAMLARRSEWKAHLLLHDEACRFTQSQTLILWGAFPDAFVRAMSGDPKQCKAYAPTANSHLGKDEDKKFLSPFGLFGQVSEVDRQLASPSFTHSHINTNWRQYSGLHALSSALFYHGSMVRGQVIDPPHAAGLQAILRKGAKRNMRGARLLVDMRGSKIGEEPVHSSFKNEPQCRYACAVIKDIHGSGVLVDGHIPKVLVIAPYAAQVDEMLRQVSLMSPVEFCAAALDVRTVSDSMSEFGDFVIVLWTRTRSVGFCAQDDLVNVAITRSRCAEMHILDMSILDEKLRHDAKFSNLYAVKKHCFDNYSITEVSESQWSRPCHRCCVPHTSKAGHSYLHCTFCRRDHHVRNCPSRASHKSMPYIPEEGAATIAPPVAAATKEEPAPASAGTIPVVGRTRGQFNEPDEAEVGTEETAVAPDLSEPAPPPRAQKTYFKLPEHLSTWRLAVLEKDNGEMDENPAERKDIDEEDAALVMNGQVVTINEAMEVVNKKGEVLGKIAKEEEEFEEFEAQEQDQDEDSYDADHTINNDSSEGGFNTPADDTADDTHTAPAVSPQADWSPQAGTSASHAVDSHMNAPTPDWSAFSGAPENDWDTSISTPASTQEW
ncbi:AAA domain-containing protein [Microdochium nivale]|nr:AAA domain-containing protein [Microdochium nivale]